MVDWLTYYSVRFIEIRNVKLAILHLALQILIIGYVIIGSVILSKGYQQYDSLSGTTILKAKGSASVGGWDGTPLEIYDAADLVVPAMEQNALFVTTNFIKTANQTRSVCEGNDPTLEPCYVNQTVNGHTTNNLVWNCINGTYTYNGVMTGRCAGAFCELEAWCPVENDNVPPVNISHVKDWTIFVKVNGEFPEFGVSVTNAVGTKPILGTNLFTIENMVNMAGVVDYRNITTQGCVVLVVISFTCNLNTQSANDCGPEYTWTRIDDPNSFSPGFNFRYVNRFTDPRTLDEYRTEWKVFGPRFLFQVYGKAGRFSFAMLVTTLGAGVALLGVSTLICDFVLLYFLPSRKKYLTEKYEEIYEEPINPTDPHPESERMAVPQNTSGGSTKTSYASLGD